MPRTAANEFRPCRSVINMSGERISALSTVKDAIKRLLEGISMETDTSPPQNDLGPDVNRPTQHFYRFHLPHQHLEPVFGSDWLALWAKAFARLFGTPAFLIGQTVVVAIWILLNVLG